MAATTASEAALNSLDGGAGEVLVGDTVGKDELYGEGGDDRLRGGFRDDLLDGGEGNDTAVFAEEEGGEIGLNRDFIGVTVNLVAGTARRITDMDTLISIENVTGSDGRDAITGNDLDNRLNGSRTTTIRSMALAAMTPSKAISARTVCKAAMATTRSSATGMATRLRSATTAT